jgi:DNA repair protein RecN (Recombination protein N)
VLTSLHISNLALIDDLRLDFEPGLNLLTGETGSGKSIIVDALGLLAGARSSVDLIKQGASAGFVEGLFMLPVIAELEALLNEAGFRLEDGPARELLVRRELSATGRNRVFVNNQMATQGFLRALGPFLADIHGQGDQQALFNPDTHLDLLDAYAGLGPLREEIAAKFRAWAALRRELAELRTDEDKKLQMLDLLRFQVDELRRARLDPDEEPHLEEERRRLNNVEKLSALGESLYAGLYDEDTSAVARLGAIERQTAELTTYEANFGSYADGLATARALLEDLAFAVRDFAARLEASPARLAEVEDRLAELSRLKRKYGGSVAAAMEHLANAETRLNLIEDSSAREAELEKLLENACADYLAVAKRAHAARLAAKPKFEKQIEKELAALAMDKARFAIKLSASDNGTVESEDGSGVGSGVSEKDFTARGIDRVEFYFSANPGEPPRALARVASGGEASRLMLVLKTLTRAGGAGTGVFDEVDSGIGGRVAEAVGLRLKGLAASEQVLCVTHQPQIAALADHHFRVVKETDGERTRIEAFKLSRDERVEELARMLTGARVTDTARRHAAEMLAAQQAEARA